MKKQIFWIASYPKSGNTLIRTLMSSLFFSNDGLFDFKLLKNIPIIEDTINIEFIKKKNPEDYKNINNLEILSKYWNQIQSKENLGFNGDFMFVKTHHALIKLMGKPFTTTDNTRGIIYIVRDPRDVALSMCNHFNFTIDKSIKSLINNNFAINWQDSKKLFDKKKKPITFLSSWQNHYLSWNENSFDCPKLIIKFEDMINNKKDVINKIVNFFAENYNFKFSNLEKKIPNIINKTSFDNLKKEEKDIGFTESVNDNFFNVGKENQWLKKLSKSQKIQIEESFYPLLKKLNYNISEFKTVNES